MNAQELNFIFVCIVLPPIGKFHVFLFVSTDRTSHAPLEFT